MGRNRYKANRYKAKKNHDATVAALGGGCIGLLVLLKLAFLGLVAWGIVMLVLWVTSK
jgi:hypothetical protein